MEMGGNVTYMFSPPPPFWGRHYICKIIITVTFVITVTFASGFFPMRAQSFVTSQEVAYIFWAIEASTEMAPSKM